MPWWTDFFDADYLRLWSPVWEHRAGPEEAAAVTALAGVEPPARVLDVPCGFGRVTRPLAEAGFGVVGVDQSAEMVAEARQRCAGLSAEIIEGDMRDLPVGGLFDAAFCLFSSIGYSGDPADDLTFLTAVKRHLEPGGALVLDTQHRDNVATRDGRRRWYEADGLWVLTEESVDWVAGTALHVIRWHSDGRWHERHYEIYLYTATELDRLLREAGFETTEFFGDFRRSPLTPATRLVLVAR